MRVAAATAAAVMGLVFVSLATGGTAAPNVRGTLVRGSATAGCFPGEPCDPPPPAAFVVFTRNHVATRVRLASDGRFAVHLRPGLYVVTVAPAAGRVLPATLRVPHGRVIRPRLVQR